MIKVRKRSESMEKQREGGTWVGKEALQAPKKTLIRARREEYVLERMPVEEESYEGVYVTETYPQDIRDGIEVAFEAGMRRGLELAIERAEFGAGNMEIYSGTGDGPEREHVFAAAQMRAFAKAIRAFLDTSESE